MIMVIWVAVAGGFGAVSRFLLDGALRAGLAGRFPVGTMVINLSGSLLLGLVTGGTLGELLPERWQLIVGTGFLGGYTTFSAASLETVRLLRERRLVAALINGLGMLVASVALAGVGLWVGAGWGAR